jgi:hypothetical protein
MCNNNNNCNNNNFKKDEKKTRSATPQPNQKSENSSK